MKRRYPKREGLRVMVQYAEPPVRITGCTEIDSPTHFNITSHRPCFLNPTTQSIEIPGIGTVYLN